MGGRDEPLTRPNVISHARDPPRRLKPSKEWRRSRGFLAVSAVCGCAQGGGRMGEGKVHPCSEKNRRRLEFASRPNFWV